VLHFIEYFVFGVLFYGWFSSFAQSGNRFPFWGAVIVGIAYAISDEWHQSFVPGRDASGWDVLFDSLGIYAASLTSPILLRKEKTS
jgi:VanZ family protein